MPRPKCRRRIFLNPKINFYKPVGVPLKNLRIVEISHEEWESLRLKFLENLDQNSSAAKMATSQSTLQRILARAQKKIGTAIVTGAAIKIIF